MHRDSVNGFIPAFIAEQFRLGLRSGSFRGSVLISDLSGFTGLTESLFSLRKKGAERLSEILNGLFESMIGSVHSRGGFVVSFAGDAFTAVFPGDDGGAALAAAEEIRAGVPESVSSGSGFHRIGMRSGVDRGWVAWHIYGSGPHTYLFSGSTVRNAAAAEARAATGDILTGEGMASSGEVVSIGPGEDDSAFSLPPPSTLEGMEELFVHPDYIAKAASPEFRDVASVFTGFDGIEDMDVFLDTVVSSAREYGGYFNLLDCGDKGNVILTLFGAPLTSGRSITRSVNFAQSLREIYGTGVRTGITYGRVFAGFIGSPGIRGHYTVIGDWVNTAARLMEGCPPGGIRISEEMARAVGGDFRLESICGLSMKGLSGKHSCFGVMGRVAGSTEALFENRFIGRDGELRGIADLLRRAASEERMSALLLTGEAGIGKTRLLYQAKSEVPDSCLVYLKCDEILSKSLNPIETFFEEVLGTAGHEDGEVSDSVFERNFRRIVGDRETSGGEAAYSAEELTRLKYVIRGFLGIEEDEEYRSLDARSRFDNTILAFMHLMKLLAGGRRLFIAIDDFQWVDEDTRSVLHDLFVQLQIDAPVICILIRPFQGPSPLELLPEGAVTLRIDLGSLRDSEQLELIGASLPCPPSDGLRRAIEEKAEGNPFYIEQMIMYLLDNELLECGGGIAELTSSKVRLPGSIVEVIISRIDALEADIRRTVKHAAVLGRRFNVRVLSGMLGGEPVDPHLLTGTEARIWSRLSELQYIFRHALIRDSVYEMQLESQLSRLHLLAGEIIEDIYPGDERMFSDLSYHFERCGQLRRMLKYTLLAADYAYDNYRNREAIEMYRKYIDAQTDVTRSRDALLRLGEVYELLGEWDTALSVFRRVMEYAGEAERTDMYVYALNRTGFIHHRMGDNEEAMDCFRRAEGYYEERGDRLSLAKVYNNIGTVHIDRNRAEEAKEYFSRALSTLEPLPEDKDLLEVTMFTYNNLGLIHQKLGDLESAAGCYEKSMKTAERTSSRRNLAALNFGNIMYLQGKVDEAEKFYRKAIGDAEKVGNRHVVRVLLNNLAAISTARGDYSGAQDLFQEALILARSMNDRKGIRLLNQNIGEIKFYLGDYESSMSFLRSAVLTAEELGDRRAMGTAHGKLGLTTCLRNLPEEARPHLEKAVEFSVEAGDMTSAHEFMFFLARVYLDLEDPDRLRETIQRMKAVPERLVQLDNRWYTQTAVMLFESYMGNRDEAEAMAAGIAETFPDTEGEALARITMFRSTGRASEVEEAVRVYRKLHDSQPMAYYLERIGYLEGLLAV